MHMCRIFPDVAIEIPGRVIAAAGARENGCDPLRPRDIRLVLRASRGTVKASRRVDWYAKRRGLPPLIAGFLDTHWRSYLLRSLTVEGEDGQDYCDAVKAMTDLAWSVRPKRDSLSRRRLIMLIPELYQRLHVGLESLSLGSGSTVHDGFFAELAKLHQTVLNPHTSAA